MMHLWTCWVPPRLGSGRQGSGLAAAIRGHSLPPESVPGAESQKPVPYLTGLLGGLKNTVLSGQPAALWELRRPSECFHTRGVLFQ